MGNPFLRAAPLFLAALLAVPPRGLAAAFELPSLRPADVPSLSAGAGLPVPVPSGADLKAPGPDKPAHYALYTVNGVEVAVPRIGAGTRLLAALPPGAGAGALSAKLRAAFAAPAGAYAEAVAPSSPAELELAARNPGAAVLSLNAFLPPGAAALFNREAGFAGPNCFNAAFSAGGLMPASRLRHVGNPEAEQLLSMYYRKVQPSSPRPGDILVLNDGDHAVYYLGGGLVFHKKSYLKQHLYRIVPLKDAYEPEPNEWKPGPFDGGSPFNDSETIRRTEAWRPTGAQYQFGQAGPEETAKAQAILFMAEQAELQAPRWALARELGYFTERLLENLVSDWSALASHPNPVLRAYYRQLESLRDQANQSIENELLSSHHAQANAAEILKRAWLPRNAYSREIVSRLLKIYGRDPSLAEKVLDAIEKDFDGQPLRHIRSGAD